MIRSELKILHGRGYLVVLTLDIYACLICEKLSCKFKRIIAQFEIFCNFVV
jgi:hypothetical protein